MSLKTFAQLGACAAAMSLLVPAALSADAVAPAPSAAPAPSGPLPLEAFAQIPFIESAALSPDGRWVAGLVGEGGQQVIAMMDLFDKTAKRVRLGIPEDTQANWVRWVNDDNIIVGLEALNTLPGGGRAYLTRVLGINRKSGKFTKILWDIGGQHASDILWVATDGRPDILVAAQASIYLGEDFWPAVYRVNVETGRNNRVLKGRSGIYDWTADGQGIIRTGIGYTDMTRSFRLLYRNGSDSFRIVDKADTRKRDSVLQPILFVPGTDHGYALHDDERGNSAVYEIDLTTQADIRVVAAAETGEIERLYIADDRSTLLGVGSSGDNAVRWLDPALAELQRQFDTAVGDRQARIVSFNRDRSKMLVSVYTADSPGYLYYYDVSAGRLQPIAPLNSMIGKRRLSPVKKVHYTARDGTPIEGILTTPKGVAGGRAPFIMMPHGGPWARDDLSYDYIPNSWPAAAMWCFSPISGDRPAMAANSSARARVSWAWPCRTI